MKLIKAYGCAIQRFCQQKQIDETLNSIAQSAYFQGKSLLSISKHLSQYESTPYPNYYIHRDISLDIPEPNPQNSLFRLILSAGLGQTFLNLQINHLKSHPVIKQLAALNANEKFVTQASRIIIDDPIGPEVPLDVLQKNIVEIEKIFEGGFNLNVAFMISQSNFHNSAWLESISKKRKAINSDILELPEGKLQISKKKQVLEELIYSQGYKLEHIFLAGYQNGQRVAELRDSGDYNLSQVMNILRMINFKGKLVLNSENFEENAQYLEGVVRKSGFGKKDRKDFEDGNWFVFL